MGNMDGGLGGWKDICTYLTLPEEGLQFIRFRMFGLSCLIFSFSFLFFFCVGI